MTAVPPAARFGHHRLDAMVAQGESLVRAFHRGLGAWLPPRKPLTFVIAAMRRGMDAVMPQGERLMRTLGRLLGTASPRKTIMLVAAGLVALGLIFVLLEINLRNELAKEATDAAPAGPNHMQTGNLLSGAPATTADVEVVGALGALAAKPFSDDAQTPRQVSRTPIPLPRPRPKR